MDDVTQVATGNSLFSLFSIMSFSLFIGYAIGMAIKKLMYFAIFIIGVFFMGISLLSYNGLLNIQWAALNGWYDLLSSGLATTGNAYLAWLATQLPVASTTTIGFVVGFKRS